MNKNKRTRAAALITALLVSLAVALLLSASLTVAMTSGKLGYRQVSSQSAVQLSDAGINSELQFIRLHTGASNSVNLSSQPVVYNGVTAKLPSGNTVIGRPGTVAGYTNGTYYVCSSNDSASTIPWDGLTSPFYITSSAVVDGVWQTVQISVKTASIFNGGGSTGGSPSTPVTVVPSPSCTNPATACSDVELTGSFNVNGSVSVAQNCKLRSTNCVNWNTNNATNQLTSSNCNGGQIGSNPGPLICPKTSDACRTCFGIQRTGSGAGCTSDNSDQDAYNTCKNHSCNNTGIYQYNNWAPNATLNPNNCTRFQGCGYSLNNYCFQSANYKPGTWDNWWNHDNNSCAVQTLIFEPGDYYFSSINLSYMASCEMICDCGALASGGTPGQVRFWIYDSGNNMTNDYIQIPITSTCAPGETSPDPGKFRIYYAKDGCTLSFTRPSNIQDCNGNAVTGDFDYYCGVHSCTKPADDNSCTKGTTVSINGTCQATATPGKGCCNFHGSMICDHLKCSGACNIQYTNSNCCTKDLCNPDSILTWKCLSR